MSKKVLFQALKKKRQEKHSGPNVGKKLTREMQTSGKATELRALPFFLLAAKGPHSQSKQYYSRLGPAFDACNG